MSLFKKPSELELRKNVRMLVYGQPGVGKSSLALSAPSPVLFDFDGGVQRVNGAFLCPTLQVHSWEEVLTALEEDLSEFKTIVIDTAGKMLDYMSAYIIRNDSRMAMKDGSLSLKGYGVRKNMFINFVTRCTMMNKHIVFVAHEREDKDGDVRIVRPEIGGSSMGDLLKELDLVGYMQSVGVERTIFWSPQEKFYAKNACNLPMYEKIPVNIDMNGGVIAENNFLAKTFEKYDEYQRKQKDLGVSYNDLVDTIKEDVSCVSDVESANGAVVKISGYVHIWDSKVIANKLLKERCDKIGLRYNKALKSYESI